MLQGSPIIRFALEVLQHALESYCSKNERDKKISVLHLAQSIELSVKAALVENNISIYEKDGHRTLNPHIAIGSLAKVWGIEKIPNQARVELLIDERNAIQHRYGSIDDITLDYHMQTAFNILSNILKSEFDTELEDWIRDNIDKKIWKKIRFITGKDDDTKNPSEAAIDNRSPVIDFIDGFSTYEKQLRSIFEKISGFDRFSGSTLDVVIKALSNSPNPPNSLIKSIPSAYKLRNQIVHDQDEHNNIDFEAVKQSLSILDNILIEINKTPEKTIKYSIDASLSGIRGTKIPNSESPAKEETEATAETEAG